MNARKVLSTVMVAAFVLAMVGPGMAAGAPATPACGLLSPAEATAVLRANGLA